MLAEAASEIIDGGGKLIVLGQGIARWNRR